MPTESAMGTIRGDFCIEVGRNICHGSDAVDSAEKEIAHWFPEGVTAYGKFHRIKKGKLCALSKLGKTIVSSNHLSSYLQNLVPMLGSTSKLDDFSIMW